jgi:hypothetical protein
MDVGLSLGYHFGAGQSGALASPLKGRVMGPPYRGRRCPVPEASVARMALVGCSQFRLAGRPSVVMVNDQLSSRRRVRSGRAAGPRGGLLFEPGLRGDYGYGQARLAFAPRDSLRWSAAAGRSPFPTSPACPPIAAPFAGRPLRTATGDRAPLPAVSCSIAAPRAAAGPTGPPPRMVLDPRLRRSCTTSCAPRAPLPDLQARALQAADDELRHAIDAARIAAVLTGAPIALDSPARSRRPPATAAAGLQRLLAESWVDGWSGRGRRRTGSRPRSPPAHRRTGRAPPGGRGRAAPRRAGLGRPGVRPGRRSHGHRAACFPRHRRRPSDPWVPPEPSAASGPCFPADISGIATGSTSAPSRLTPPAGCPASVSRSPPSSGCCSGARCRRRPPSTCRPKPRRRVRPRHCRPWPSRRRPRRRQRPPVQPSSGAFAASSGASRADGALLLLGLLQREGRLVDFLASRWTAPRRRHRRRRPRHPPRLPQGARRARPPGAGDARQRGRARWWSRAASTRPRCASSAGRRRAPFRGIAGPPRLAGLDVSLPTLSDGVDRRVSPPRRCGCRDLARYSVGIDLGTTTPPCAPSHGGRAIRPDHPFRMPAGDQPGEVERAGHPALVPAAAHRAGGPARGPVAALVRATRFTIGTMARERGSELPHRLVSSAKSWLCHTGVDRHAPVCPGAGPRPSRWPPTAVEAGHARVSPVEASALYLEHVRAAWNDAHPDDRWKSRKSTSRPRLVRRRRPRADH